MVRHAVVAVVWLLMLAAKIVAYCLTRSSAILADAAESVVLVIAIVFAAFSLRLDYEAGHSEFPLRDRRRD